MNKFKPFLMTAVVSLIALMVAKRTPLAKYL